MSPTDWTEDNSYIASRPIGDATITVISDGELLWAPRFPVPDAVSRQAMPEADAFGRVRLGLNVVLIGLGAARIVVDPALDDPGTSFERRFIGTSSMEIRRSPGLGAGFEEIGWMPAEVTHVVITHPHGDHYAGVMVEHEGELAIRFPNARHYLDRADWEGNLQRQARNTELNRRLGAVDRDGLLELVDGEREIVPGVSLVPAPGETPGHMVVRVNSAGEELYVLGDLFHHRCEVEHLDWAPAHADAPQLEITRRDLFGRLAGSGALAVAAHEPFPGWGRITRVGDGFRLEPA
ncbi:MAG TPA: MBL fold metallo-hydrolase [Thermomicrobiales bacterium]|nr:MBL fold metallo-hydrolase [Thermomicrobiales bacterium]